MTAPLVVVVGAGPAGMAAASAAAEHGSRVILVDQNFAPGGQLWRGYESHVPHSSPHGGVFRRQRARLRASGAEIWPEAPVIDAPAPNVLRLERAGRWHDQPWDRLILATGARERFLPFPGWTLPRVTGVGGLQALVEGGLSVSGKRIVLAGSGPLLLAVSASLADSGAQLAGIFEQAPLASLIGFGATLLAHPGKLVEGARYRWQARRAPFQTSWWIRRALGQDRVQRVVVTNGRTDREISCDYLGCGFHLVPNLELAQLLGCHIESGYASVNDRQETSIPGIYCAGEPTGIGGLDKSLVEGEIAGLAAAGQFGKAAAFRQQREKLHRFARRLDAAFALRPELRAVVTPDTLVCRCEDVTCGELSRSTTGRAAKIHTRCGMGPCQGRICGPATEFLFGWTVASARPPLFPARVTTLASNATARCEPQPVPGTPVP